MTSEKRAFWCSSAACAGMLAVLLLSQPGAQLLQYHGAGRLLRTVLAEARGRHVLSWRLASRDTTRDGYYENLLHGSEQAEGRSLAAWLWTGEKWVRKSGWMEIYQNDPYLLWEPRPNLNKIDPDEGPVVTNSRGMFSRQCSLNKPPGVRRIALLGDSLSRGFGVPIDQRLDVLLERKLNLDPEFQGSRHFEILNFAVTAYRPTQMYDVAVRKASPFHPDVYLFPLTELGVTEKWWDTHIAEMISRGINLRYDFLHEALAGTGVDRSDSRPVIHSKLLHYRLPVLRTILVHLKAFADANSAQVIVLLLGSVQPPELQSPHFADARAWVVQTGIAMVDLLDTFRDAADLDAFRLSWYDSHPNPVGHRLIAENLYRKVRADPRAWSALIGP